MSSENPEFQKFKNEIISIIKETENKLELKLNSHSEKISIIESKYTTNMEKIFIQTNELITNQANYNVIFDKIKNFDNFISKTNDFLTNHEIRLNSLSNDYYKSVHKYDKIYLDNLLLPGFIGECCKYKNVKEFNSDLITHISKFKIQFEKNNLDLKGYKEKLENIIKSFNLMMENNMNANMKYATEIGKKTENFCVELVKPFNEKIIELKMENSKFVSDLINKSFDLKDQWEKLISIKNEIYKNFENEVNKFKIINNNSINKINEYKNDFLEIKKKFTELAEFIKDVRFRKNLGIEVKRKEYVKMAKNLSNKKKFFLFDDDDIKTMKIKKLNKTVDVNDKNENFNYNSNDFDDNFGNIRKSISQNLLFENDNINNSSNKKKVFNKTFFKNEHKNVINIKKNKTIKNDKKKNKVILKKMKPFNLSVKKFNLNDNENININNKKNDDFSIEIISSNINNSNNCNNIQSTNSFKKIKINNINNNNNYEDEILKTNESNTNENEKILKSNSISDIIKTFDYNKTNLNFIKDKNLIYDLNNKIEYLNKIIYEIKIETQNKYSNLLNLIENINNNNNNNSNKQNNFQEKYIKLCLENYEKSINLCDEISYKNALKLELLLNISVFYYDILKDKELAITISKETLDNVKIAFKDIEEENEEYKNSINIINILSENIELWTKETNFELIDDYLY